MNSGIDEFLNVKFIKEIYEIISNSPSNQKLNNYFSCLERYLQSVELMTGEIEKIFEILEKFFGFLADSQSYVKSKQSQWKNTKSHNINALEISNREILMAIGEKVDSILNEDKYLTKLKYMFNLHPKKPIFSANCNSVDKKDQVMSGGL